MRTTSPNKAFAWSVSLLSLRISLFPPSRILLQRGATVFPAQILRKKHGLPRKNNLISWDSISLRTIWIATGPSTRCSAPETTSETISHNSLNCRRDVAAFTTWRTTLVEVEMDSQGFNQSCNRISRCQRLCLTVRSTQLQDSELIFHQTLIETRWCAEKTF